MKAESTMTPEELAAWNPATAEARGPGYVEVECTTCGVTVSRAAWRPWKNVSCDLVCEAARQMNLTRDQYIATRKLVVEDWRTGKYSWADLSRRYGITHSTVMNWCRIADSED